MTRCHLTGHPVLCGADDSDGTGRPRSDQRYAVRPAPTPRHQNLKISAISATTICAVSYYLNSEKAATAKVAFTCAGRRPPAPAACHGVSTAQQLSALHELCSPSLCKHRSLSNAIARGTTDARSQQLVDTWRGSRLCGRADAFMLMRPQRAIKTTGDKT